ncbi:MAG: VOC family protein [Pseudomonadota bacterium]
MEQRVSLITLGVDDIDRARTFYTALGWQTTDAESGIVVFDLVGCTLGLYERAALAEETGLLLERGSGSLALAHNVREREDVIRVLERAHAAGGELVKPAQDVFWGGHHGYFRDPDAHLWEVAFNPFSPLSPDGAFRWRGYGDT